MSLIASGPAAASPTRPWPADQVEHWPLERLIAYANNPRLRSEADLDKIAASIRKWGWTNTVLVDEQGVLIAGHARVGAAARLGLKSIPVIVARGWSDEEKQGYRLADRVSPYRANIAGRRPTGSHWPSKLVETASGWRAGFVPMGWRRM